MKTLFPCRRLSGWFFPDSAAPAPPSPVGSGAWFPGSHDASLAALLYPERPNSAAYKIRAAGATIWTNFLTIRE
jgi:hypothetical protein